MDMDNLIDEDQDIENEELTEDMGEDGINNGSNSNEDTNNENNDACEIDDDSNFVYKRLLRRQSGQSKQQCAKEERNATIRKVSCILQKPENERTADDELLLKECGDIVQEVESRKKKRDEAKRRLEEFEEPNETLKQKCNILAQAIAQSQHLVVYTGAGISTAARIPDYRGTNGIWTMLQQGKSIGNHDLSLAEPTYTHMALSELYKRNILKYVVSQNCDGLHLRSGLPRTALSEVHGNMYMEVCKTCKPSREYWRLFDVTENTARYSHKTMRKCYVCNGPLNDTIVHFGERGSLLWPLNWSGASKNARKATTILCLGSSLKVLKKYPWLWQMHKPVKRRPNLYIVNLQWTPKDDCANVKVHGKCDVVMAYVMDLLGIQVPTYDRNKDPIFIHGTHLLEQECHTTTQPFLKFSGKNVPGKVIKLDEVKHDEKGEPVSDQVEKGKDGKVLNGHGTNVKKEEDDTLEPSDDQIDNDEFEDHEQELADERIDDDEDMPINYSNKDLTTIESKHPDDCDTISNIYSINKVPLAATTTDQNSLPTCRNTLQQMTTNPLHTWHTLPQPAHNNSKSNLLQTGGLNISQAAVKPMKITATENAMNLVTKDTLQSTLFTQNCQALLTYYQLSNTLLQSQLGLQAYRDMLYPLQTSLLYSGLHSIINPTPFITEDHNGYAMYGNSIKQEASVMKVEDPEATCEYCFENYKSFTCVFYEKLEPGFVKQEYRFSKVDNCEKALYCLCCDYTTEEEDDENVEGVPPDKMTKLQDDNGEQKAKIQPGWYGKGYRKGKKQRKKAGA